MSAELVPEKPTFDEILKGLRAARLGAEHSAVERLVQQYRDHFGLGPRDRESERATEWIGMSFRGNIVAVLGERREDRTLEVTDAYFDGTDEGRIGVFTGLQAYRSELEHGDVDSIVATVLYANEPMWTAIVRETKQVPYALVFVIRRPE